MIPAFAQNLQPYQGIGPATQIHASANHWGNSTDSGMLINSVYYPFGLLTSRVAWEAGGANSTVINSYDVGLYCLSGSCQAGRLYAHTGPLLGTYTNPSANAVRFAQWVSNDGGTVCQTIPCALPPGMYSMSTGTSEMPSASVTIWGDGSTLLDGGAEFHNINTTSDPSDSYVSGWASSVSNTHPTGSTTQVTVMTHMLQELNGQTVGCLSSAGCDGFQPGQQILVTGLDGAGCSGHQVVDSADPGSPAPLKFTINANVTCTLTQSTSGCSSHVNTACVAYGLPPQLNKIPDLTQLSNGFYCFPSPAACSRNAPPGPAGPQSASHSVGFTAY
jgi:hypothetical protein